MKASNNFNGVVVPLTTPFTKEGHVDEAAAERLVDHIAAHHLGVFVLGTTGETASIPRTERYKLVEAVTRAAGNRVPVYAGIGDNCLENSIIATRKYQDAGVTAVVSHLPSYYPLEPEEMFDYFKLLHGAVDGPLVIYNIPVTTHMSIPVDIIQRLAELPNIVGFKDSENKPGRMEEVYLKLGGRPDFGLFMGSALLSVKSLKLGYTGLVPSTGNVDPELWKQLFDAARKGNWSLAESLQEKQDEISALFQRGRTLGQSLAALKAALSAIGICEPTVLPPLKTMSPGDCHALAEELFNLCPSLRNNERPNYNRG